MGVKRRGVNTYLVKLYDYTCCEGGDNVGEECGDYSVEWAVIFPISVLLLLFLPICIGVAICWKKQCCCFTKHNLVYPGLTQQQPQIIYVQAPPGGMVQQQAPGGVGQPRMVYQIPAGGGPPGSVVGQPIFMQVVQEPPPLEQVELQGTAPGLRKDE